MLEPHTQRPKQDSAEPARAELRSESMEATLPPSNKLNVLPRVMLLKSDAFDPICTMQRIETVEPDAQKFRTLILSPHFAKERIETALPIWK
jgi:hypothetical protein